MEGLDHVGWASWIPGMDKQASAKDLSKAMVAWRVIFN